MRKVATPLIVAEQAAPATPPTGFVSFYAKADGFLYRKDDAGTETQLGRLFIDDDSMATATATNVASAESTKAYTDNVVTALDELAAGVRTTINTGTPGFQKVDVSLSAGIASGDTLTGGTGSGEDLTLASTAHATRGTIFVRDIVELLSEDKTNTTDTPVKIMEIPSTRTITLGNTTSLNPGNSVEALRFAPTVLYDEPGNVFNSASVFVNAALLKNRNAETRTIYGINTYLSIPTLQADGATVTFNSYTGFIDGPIFSVTASGVANVTSVTGLQSGASAVGSGCTVTTRRGVWINDTGGIGTVTTGIGIDIDPLADATTSIGIRNAATTVRTPPTATNITGVSGTIPHNASKINITANGSYTLTSTPTITDGQHGETLTIMNVDSTDVITIQDQGTLASSNLRLTATTVAIGPRDSIELTYDSTVGDWVQTGPLVAVL